MQEIDHDVKQPTVTKNANGHSLTRRCTQEMEIDPNNCFEIHADSLYDASNCHFCSLSDSKDKPFCHLVYHSPQRIEDEKPRSVDADLCEQLSQNHRGDNHKALCV